jgi:hypothetical protein
VPEANGRFYFEAMPLGTSPPVSFSFEDVRSTRGFVSPGLALQALPIVGSYGYAKSLSIPGDHVSSSGDFLEWLRDMDLIVEYLKRSTQSIEDKFVLRHDVANRSLGTVAYVRDYAQRFSVTTINVGVGTQGTVRLFFTNPSAVEIVIGDRIVVSQEGIPNIGEISAVTDVQYTGSGVPPDGPWVEFVSRLSNANGTSPYEPVIASMRILIAEGYWEGYSFRDINYSEPRTLADGGSIANGVRFSFEGSGRFVRRTGIAPLAFTPTGRPLGNKVIASSGVIGDIQQPPQQFPSLG